MVGVDLKPQDAYPFKFYQADAMEMLGDSTFLQRFDFIHASPPCQRYSRMTWRWPDRVKSHPDLIEPVREALIDTGIPWTMENVEYAPLLEPLRLCGSMFGLEVRRHRFFESSFPMVQPACAHHLQDHVIRVYGSTGGSSKRDKVQFGTVDDWRRAMDIDWMTSKELKEAIPPAYSEHIMQAWLVDQAW